MTKAALQENASWFGMGQNASASPGKHECTAVATGQTCTDDGMEMPDWGDEDLLAMQAEPMVPCLYLAELPFVYPDVTHSYLYMQHWRSEHCVQQHLGTTERACS